MRVAIAEDSGIVRQGLVALLGNVGVEVTLAVATGKELVVRIADKPPDIVIIDLRMPPTHTDEGVTTARQIRQAHPEIGILVLSSYNETPQALRLFEDNSHSIGYLLKDHVTDVAALRDALDRVCHGEVVIDPDVVRRLVTLRQENQALSALSDREREVLSLMAEGHTNASIAQRLYLSARTVEDHVREIFRKLKIGGVEDAQRPGEANKRVLAVLAWLRATRPR